MKIQKHAQKLNSDVYYSFQSGAVKESHHKIRLSRITSLSSVLAMFVLITMGVAFFSDFIHGSGSAESGCLQVTPVLSIDGQTGDRLNVPNLQSSATCIPADYSQVAYVTFTGTQYINTGIYGFSTVSDIKADFQFSSTAGRNATLFGATQVAVVNPMPYGGGMYFQRADTNFQMSSGNSTTPSATFIIAKPVFNADRHIVEFTNTGGTTANYYFDNSLISNAVQLPANVTSGPIFIGNLDSGGTGPGASNWFSGDLYSFSIAKAGTLVANYIPVINNKTGVYGMFDTVSGKLANLTGTLAGAPAPLTANPNCDNLNCNGQYQGDTSVSVEPNTVHDFSYTLTNTGTVDYQNYTGDTISAWLDSPYLPVDSLTFTGTQFIDSGINQTTPNMTIKADYQMTRTPSTLAFSMLFGVQSGSNTLDIVNNYGGPYLGFQYGAATATTFAVAAPGTGNLGAFQTRGNLTITTTTNASNVSSATATATNTANNNTGTAKPANTMAANATPMHMFIGGANSSAANTTPVASQLFVGDLYSFSIASNNVMVRDYVPVYNTVSKQCGLFDKVSGQFFGNLGTGTIGCSLLNSTPTNYSPVDYLQFSGTQYINTGVDYTGSIAANVDFQYTATTGSTLYVFGARPAINGSDGLYLSGVAGSSLYGIYNNVQNTLMPTIDLNRHKVTFSSSTGWTLDGAQKGVAPSSLTSATPQNIFLGGFNNGGQTVAGLTGKIYSFSISQSGTLLRDMIPVVNDKTGECGMYDRVTNQFFGNSGTGTITCSGPNGGSQITITPILPNPLRVLLYQESTSDTTINADIMALDGGAATAPNAIATINGSVCSVDDVFYGTDSGIKIGSPTQGTTPICSTAILPSTLGVQTAVGDSQTYNYKFVVYIPSTAITSIFSGTKVYFGVASGAKNLVGNAGSLGQWKQQVHPYLNTKTPVGNPPTFAIGNTQPFLDQVVPNSAVIPSPNTGNLVATSTYLENLPGATDIEDGICNFAGTNGCKITIASDGGFDPSKVGTYNIKYLVVDSDGNMSSITIPVTVWNFVKIANGQYHGVALGSNGSLWTWGYNVNGQRAQGNTTSASTMRAPTQVAQSTVGNLPIIDIAGSNYSSCALNSAGAIYCWGAGASGVLGNGGTADSYVPTMVTMPSNGVTFTQIDGAHGTGAGGGFVALGSDGNAYVWGNGAGYRAGTGGTANVMVPTKITTTGDIVQVSQGASAGAAVTSSGQVYVWGMNNQGQQAYNNTTASTATTSLPHLVSGLPQIKQVSAGGYSDNGFITALATNGTVWAWGWSYGVGNGAGANSLVPIQISGLSNIRQISAGADFVLAVTGDNNVYGTGYANYGELFNGNTTTQTTPVKSALANVVGNVGFIAGGYDDAWFLSIDGKMVWGIGYCDTAGQEFGSMSVQASSTSVVVSWSFTPKPAP